MTRKRNGFTLVELIVVIVLISVLAVYAAPKLSDMSEDLESPFYSMAMSRIRSVQEANMTTDDGNCSLMLMAAGAIAEVRTGDGKCYDSDKVTICKRAFGIYFIHQIIQIILSNRAGKMTLFMLINFT